MIKWAAPRPEGRGEDSHAYPKLLWFADASHERSPLIISSAPMPPLAEYAGQP